MGAKLGLDAKVYYLSNGTAGVVGTRTSWGNTTNGITGAAAPNNLLEITSARNVTPTISKGQADVSTRGNNGWKATLGTLKDATVEVECVYDLADPAQQLLISSFMTNANVPIAALDGDKATVGVMGLWADMQVVDLNKGEPLEEGQTVSYTLKPGLSSVAPQWVKVFALAIVSAIASLIALLK